MQATTFQIVPNGPFSLDQANNFEFGHREAETGAMVMAFAADGSHEPVGVVLRQAAENGPVEVQVEGSVPEERVRRQVERILSLDHDGTAWAKVAASDPPLARAVAGMPGLRPVLFHSPYETAAWSIIPARRQRSQGAAIRDRIAADLGTTFQLDGRTMHAFPPAERIFDGLDTTSGLASEQVDRLRGVARAAADGDLEAAELQRLGPEAAVDRVLQLKGIGPFYAMLIVVRGTGFADTAPPAEPRTRAAIGRAYGLGGPATDAQASEISEAWRPFRTWATVTFRAAAARGLI